MILYIISPSLIYCVTGSLYLLIPFTHFSALQPPLPLAATSVFFVLWACFVSIFHFFLKISHVSETTWFFFISLSMVLSRSVYVVANDNIFFFFLWVNNISYIPHFLYQFIHQWTLGCFLILTVINSVTVNMGMQVSF